ncbi:hypothetical protein [Desulfocurvibacter africanus]|uniref:hypothetical protein n=1 Tax=Desulfocurvibacter africanus TaxID=873 RepID=UPI00041DCD5F|nr:hypothetical protein [Desulfocurvibacter africanus]
MIEYDMEDEEIEVTLKFTIPKSEYWLYAATIRHNVHSDGENNDIEYKDTGRGTDVHTDENMIEIIKQEVYEYGSEYGPDEYEVPDFAE